MGRQINQSLIKSNGHTTQDGDPKHRFKSNSLATLRVAKGVLYAAIRMIKQSNHILHPGKIVVNILSVD
jgi:hypothetical protein